MLFPRDACLACYCSLYLVVRLFYVYAKQKLRATEFHALWRDLQLQLRHFHWLTIFVRDHTMPCTPPEAKCTKKLRATEVHAPWRDLQLQLWHFHWLRIFVRDHTMSRTPPDVECAENLRATEFHVLWRDF